MSIVLEETFFGVGFDLGSEPWCEDDLRGAGEDFGLSQTLGAKCNLTKFLGGENGGRSGHFHFQAAFQRLNTVCLVGLTGLSVETLPGSFATKSCDWRSPQLLGTHSPCTYKPANLAGGRQRTVRGSLRTLTAQRPSIQKAILQTTSFLKVKFNQTQEY